MMALSRLWMYFTFGFGFFYISFMIGRSFSPHATEPLQNQKLEEFFQHKKECPRCSPCEEVKERDQASNLRSAFHDLLKLPRKYISRKESRVLNLPLAKENRETTVFELNGSGCVQILQFTFVRAHTARPHHCVYATLAQALRVRIYVDGMTDPLVDEVLSHLFGIHHPEHAMKTKNQEMGIPLNNLLYGVSANGCLFFNVYMPFASGLKVTLQDMDDGPIDIAVWSFIEYEEYKIGALTETKRFRVQHRNVVHNNTLESAMIRGSGALLGVSFGVQQGKNSPDTWFHNSGESILLDTDLESATVIRGVGGEDFFHDTCSVRSAYAFSNYGVQYSLTTDQEHATAAPIVFSGYRIWVGIQQYLFDSSFLLKFGCYHDDMCESTTYWYQEIPFDVRDEVLDKGFHLKISRELSLEEVDSFWMFPDFERIKHLYSFSQNMQNSFIDLSRLVGHSSSVKGNEKMKKDFGVTASFSLDTAKICKSGESDCCMSVHVFHDDDVKVFLGYRAVFEGKTQTGFRWGKSDPFRVVNGEQVPVTILLKNTINQNHRAVGFGIKVNKAKNCNKANAMSWDGCKAAGEKYLAQNEDMKDVAAWIHYFLHGKKEGRQWPGDAC